MRVVAEALYSSVPAWGSLVCGALTVVCASASYEWLEAPIRGNPWLARRAIRSISLGACLTLLGAAAGIGVWARAKHFVASPTQRAVVSATEQNSVASQQGCLIGATEAKPVSCTLGSVASSFTVVLFGDSHADEWSTPLAAIANAEGWRLVTYLKASCAAADFPVYDVRLHRISHECAEWRAKAVDAIIRLHPNVIVVGELSSGYIVVRPLPWRERGNLVILEVRPKANLSELSRSGSPIMLLRDNPTPHRDMRTCLERAAWRGETKTCDMPRSSVVDSTLTVVESQTNGDRSREFDLANIVSDRILRRHELPGLAKRHGDLPGQ